MITRLVPISDPGWQTAALSVIQAGDLVAFPTDTVYGVGTSAFNNIAVERIFLAKDRPNDRSIPVLLGDIADLEKVCTQVSPLALKLASYFWPGPLTIVVPKHPDIPESVSRSATIGIRIPDHPIAGKLLCLTGPLAVTSANLSGMYNPRSAGDVMEQLGGRIEMIIDGGRVGMGTASTVVNCMGTDPELLREGPISLKQILAALGR
jgi:L-threonylcarbamoyladenylate synthase